MDEYMLRAYLQSRSKDKDSDSEFIRRMRNALRKDRYPRDMRRASLMGDFYDDRMYDDFYVNRHSDAQLEDILDDLDADDKEKLFKMIMSEGGGQMGDDKAKHLVSKMYHTSGGRKYVGEKFDMAKAKEVYERFRGVIPSSATPADVYIALNAQYHDYCDLFKAWFGDNIDSKIVESAVNFWFKDNDYKGSNKVHDYFKEA